MTHVMIPINVAPYLYLVDTGNSTFANITSIAISPGGSTDWQFTAICLGLCPYGYYNFYTFSTAKDFSTCQTCALFVSNCSVCSQQGKCFQCFRGNYMLEQTNHCFHYYPRGYYNHQLSGRCLPCDCNYECIDVKSQECKTCRLGWSVNGGCTTIPGCS